MSETDKSQKFIKEQKEKYGKILFIEKIITNHKKGEPDISAVFKGMPISAEAKLINSISYKNNYPFKELQLDTLEEKSKAGAMCIGILFKDNEVRYLMWYDLKEYLNKSDWEKAEVFDWEILLSRWMQNILTSF
jgi:penicillin-binding protein-related factor A (putative recombinase)